MNASGFFLLIGILIVVFGLGAIVNPVATTVTLTSDAPVLAVRLGTKLGADPAALSGIGEAAADMGAGAVIVGEDLEIAGTVVELAPK